MVSTAGEIDKVNQRLAAVHAPVSIAAIVATTSSSPAGETLSLIPDGTKPALRIARNTQLALIYSDSSGVILNSLFRASIAGAPGNHTHGFRRKGIR
jgi:hypothetical protein